VTPTAATAFVFISARIAAALSIGKETATLRSAGRSRRVRHIGIFAAQRLDLGGVDASVARHAAENGPPPTEPTANPKLDHKTRIKLGIT
jgi:hypothetical protein